MNRRGILLFISMVLVFVLLAGYLLSRRAAVNGVAREARRSTYALCVAQNSARAIARRNSVVLYGQLSDELRYRREDLTPKEIESVTHRLRTLEVNLAASRPLNCATYVRPELPPDTGE